MPSLEKRHGTNIHVLDHKSNDIYWCWRDVSELNINLVLHIANLLHSPTAAGQAAAQSPKYFPFYNPNLKLIKAKQRGSVEGQGKHQQLKQKLKKELSFQFTSYFPHSNS